GEDGRSGIQPAGSTRHQINVCAPPIDHGQQASTGEPGAERLPFRPFQLLRHIAWSDRIPAIIVNGAAMDGPELTADAINGRNRKSKRAVYAVEIKGGTNPSNCGDNMQPAQTEMQPFGNVRFHYRFLECV